MDAPIPAGRIRKISHNSKQILIVDYSECKPDGMIEVFNGAKKLVQQENKPVLVLSIVRKNYITPAFMRQAEQGLKETESLIERNAVIGLSEVQKWILKGMNLWYKRQLHHFDSYDDALAFLVSDQVAAPAKAPR